MGDIRGLIFQMLRGIIKQINLNLFTILTYIKSYFQGIKIGNKNSFYGKTILIKRYKSTIIIGKNNIFRSSVRSNQYGLFKRNSICTLKPKSSIKIGDNCGFSGCSISSAEKVVISDNVLIGANTIISDFDWHGIENRSEALSSPVIIEENVWIGANSIILKGITIGKNTTIGAGSVVTKDIPSNCISAGNPCKVIRHIDK